MTDHWQPLLVTNLASYPDWTGEISPQEDRSRASSPHQAVRTAWDENNYRRFKAKAINFAVAGDLHSALAPFVQAVFAHPGQDEFISLVTCVTDLAMESSRQGGSLGFVVELLQVCRDPTQPRCSRNMPQ